MIALLPALLLATSLTSFLDVCSAGDPSKISEWSRTAYEKTYVAERGMDGLISADQRICATTGGFVLRQTPVETADSIFAWATAVRNGAWYRLAFLTDAEGKIVRRSFAQTLPPPDEVPGAYDDQSIPTFVTSYLDALEKNDQFSGAVLLARGDTILVQTARGFADREKRIRNTPATRFSLASTVKMLTSTAIADLVARGKLHFTDRLVDRVPQINNPAFNEITIAQLLSHTSGLPRFFETPEQFEMIARNATIGEYVTAINRLQLEFPPGTRASYSNAGFLLLGAVIESVGGESYGEFLRHHVLRPAKMSDTSIGGRVQVTKTAVPYTFLQPDGTTGKSRVATCSSSECGNDRGSSAGGGYATVLDYFRFARSIMSGRIVPRPIVEAQLQRHALSPWGTDYGYGFAIERVGNTTFFGHAGDFTGANAELAMTREGWTIVVLSNYERPSATGVADVLKALIARIEEHR